MKDETFHLEKGLVWLEMDGEGRLLVPGDTVHIPPRTPHRLSGLEDSVILEFSTRHGDQDCVRDEPSRRVPADVLKDLLRRAAK